LRTHRDDAGNSPRRAELDAIVAEILGGPFGCG
jgi:hypothetical protein